MIKDISKSDFISEFAKMGRENQFTYNGKCSLYDYLTQLEGEIDNKIYLDIIALCCEYTEYRNLIDYLSSNTTDIDIIDFECDGEFEAEEYEKAVLEEIQNKTTLINIDDGGFIIQQY